MSDEKQPLKILEMKRSEFTEMTEALEHKVQQSKDGKIAAIALVVEYEDGDMGFCVFHGQRSNWMKMVSELERAKLRVLLRHGEILEDM